MNTSTWLRRSGCRRSRVDGLVDAVDAWCEDIAFTAAQCERLFAAAAGIGLRVRLHAEQLSNVGGSPMAARHRALSCDHLEYTSEDDAAALAAAGTVAVMLPIAFYALAETRRPPIDAFRRLGVSMAVASDCNPGSAPGASLLLAMNMARRLFGLTSEEVLLGVTRHAARALAWTASAAHSRRDARQISPSGRSMARRARLLDGIQPLQHGRARGRDRARAAGLADAECGRSVVADDSTAPFPAADLTPNEPAFVDAAALCD